MPPYRLARMTEEQMSKLESLENEIGLTLVAYEPADDTHREQAPRAAAEGESPDDLISAGLLDTYRTDSPLPF